MINQHDTSLSITVIHYVLGIPTAINVPAVVKDQYNKHGVLQIEHGDQISDLQYELLQPFMMAHRQLMRCMRCGNDDAIVEQLSKNVETFVRPIEQPDDWFDTMNETCDSLNDKVELTIESTLKQFKNESILRRLKARLKARLNRK